MGGLAGRSAAAHQRAVGARQRARAQQAGGAVPRAARLAAAAAGLRHRDSDARLAAVNAFSKLAEKGTEAATAAEPGENLARY